MHGGRVTHRLGNDVATVFPGLRPLLLVDAPSLFLVPLGVANLALDLALDVFGFALYLLTCVAGQPADRVSELAFHLLGRAFDLVFLAVSIEVI